ncbi:MAG: FecR domain-containing protein, partial [Verrucomicrobiales bacterium]
KLTSGIATIRFNSGAEVMLEAPAHLVIESPMRAKLLAGSAVIDVPESAIGFVIETPDGYAVDHGTQFAVSVDRGGRKSDFEVLEGEISVHLPKTGEGVRLANRESASISNSQLQSFNGPLPERDVRQRPRVIKITPDGRATSIIKNNQREKRLDPDLLMVKNVDGNSQERRSLISFDVSGVDLESVASAKLGLKMVPSGVGFATRLPVENRFAIYGVTDSSKEDWSMDCRWEDAPTPEDGELLGTFKVRRSRQDKYCTISGDALLSFLKADADGSVTMILVRETGQIDGDGPGLVHAFASDSHPESSGPVLRLNLAE